MALSSAWKIIVKTKLLIPFLIMNHEATAPNKNAARNAPLLATTALKPETKLGKL